MRCETLVIACGNPLRSDDGVGRAAADIVEAWQLPGVTVLSVHQLVPELIEEMKHAERVLFIDAGTNNEDRGFKVLTVLPSTARHIFGHHETPAKLLALLFELEGRAPQTHLVSIAAHSFEHGDAMTVEAQKHLQSALIWIRDFLEATR